MRLSSEHQQQIVTLTHQYFGEQIKLYLFGSRVDDHKKGGDIDLFLESTTEINLETELKFLVDIAKNVTERKVDLLVKMPTSLPKAIFATAKNEGIRLC